MEVLLARVWVAFMVIVTIVSAIAFVGGVSYFIINTIGWIPILAVAGLGAGMTILFKITSWAEKVLERKTDK